MLYAHIHQMSFAASHQKSQFGSRQPITGDGRIISGPKDTEAVVGTQLVLRCKTDIKDSINPVEWYFKANNYEAYDAIYKDGLILNGSRGKMKVEANVSSGHYDLVIFSVSVDNAGAYTCLDDDSQQRAEIVVFEHKKMENSEVIYSLLLPFITGFGALMLLCVILIPILVLKRYKREKILIIHPANGAYFHDVTALQCDCLPKTFSASDPDRDESNDNDIDRPGTEKELFYFPTTGLV